MEAQGSNLPKVTHLVGDVTCDSNPGNLFAKSEQSAGEV
jgi:hypothetical protein